MTVAPNEVDSPVSFDELMDTVKAEAKNAGREAAAEKWAEDREKEYKRFLEEAGKSREEHLEKFSENFKKALVATGPAGHAAKSVQKDGRPGELVAGMLPFLAKSGYKHKHQQEQAAEEAMSKGFEAHAKAIQASVYESGGVLVEDRVAEDFIEALYPNNIVLALGANTLDITEGGIATNKQGQTATAYWGSELSSATVSNPTYKEKKLTPHKLTVLVPITNEMVDRRPQGMQTLVLDDMTGVAMNALDIGFIRADGTEDQPLGIRHQLASDNEKSLTSSPTVAEVATDLQTLMYLPDKTDVPMSRPGWMSHPRMLHFLMSLRTSDGFPIYQQELTQGTLMGANVGTSTQIPNELGGGSDETELYYGDFSQVVVGQSRQLRIQRSDSATYIDADGNTVHAFTQDVQLTKLQTYGDIVLRHEEAFSVGTGDWGNGFDS